MNPHTVRARATAALVGAAVAAVLALPAPLAAAQMPHARPLAQAAESTGARLTAAAALRATQATAATAAPATPGQATPGHADTDAGRSFFRTTTGKVSLVLMAGAAGYAVYSFTNGRVKSPAK